MTKKYGLLGATLSVVLGIGLLISPVKAAPSCQIGLVFDLGGKDDKSFNSAALEGLNKTKNELKCTVKAVEPTDHNSFEPMLKAFAQKKYDLVIAVGVSQVEAVKKVAAQFPEQKFVILDGEVKAANVKSFLFQEHEGSFLVGAIAGMMSKSNTIGFVGGMDIPIVRRFAAGFEAGVKKVSPQAKVNMNFIGNTAEAWNNPAKAKELALMQYSSGVDVIFGVAGASGFGIFDAAEEKKKFVIGVDSNQNWIKPGYVLTSMVKKMDQAVFSVTQDLVQGKFLAGTLNFDLANQGVGYTVDSYNKNILPQEVLKKVEKLKADIIAKKIQVPDFYQMRKNPKS